MIGSNPLVSVIVPCYNHEKYIEECILSIVNQTYQNIEIIVIDDGSKDSSSQILEQLSKKYNFYFEKQINHGVAKTLNKCLSLTHSNLVVSISSDDVLMPNAVSDFISKYMELEGNFSLIFGDSFLMNDKSEIIKINKFRCIAKKDEALAFSTFLDFFKYYRKELLNSEYIGSYSSFLIGNYIPVGMMYNKKMLISIGAWNENLKLEDHDFWIRLSKLKKFEFTNTIVSKYRFHPNNSFDKYKQELLKNNIDMLIVEKKFIKQYNTKKDWSKGYNESLLNLLKCKEYTLFIKYYNFSICFVCYAISRVFKKLLNLF